MRIAGREASNSILSPANRSQPFLLKGILTMATLACVLVCAGCATAVRQTDSAMSQYDKNTRYAVDDRADGFTVSVYYSRYQMIPESSAVAVACRQQALAIAWEVARKRGRTIQQINEQEVRISMGRNGVSGITSCTASAPAYYL